MFHVKMSCDKGHLSKSFTKKEEEKGKGGGGFFVSMCKSIVIVDRRIKSTHKGLEHMHS